MAGYEASFDGEPHELWFVSLLSMHFGAILPFPCSAQVWKYSLFKK
jgi:hypothetical protein